MKYSISGIILYFLFDLSDSLLECPKCAGFVNGIKVNCSETCFGDACFSLETFIGYEIQGIMSYGCISGKIPEPGCRINHSGQTLCLCSDADNCSMANQTQSYRMQLRACDRSIENEGLPRTITKWDRPCAAPYCTVIKTEILSRDMDADDEDNCNYSRQFDTSLSITKKYTCAQDVDFDVFNSHSTFFYYPQSCAYEETALGNKKTSCYTNESPIDIDQISFETYELECYLDSYSPFTMKTRNSNGTCTGQFCVISQTPQGMIHQGCLTVDERTSDRQMEAGYYRHHNGREQWLCTSQMCNVNLETLLATWPADLEPIMNISTVRYLTAAEVISSSWIMEMEEPLDSGALSFCLINFIILLLTLSLLI